MDDNDPVVRIRLGSLENYTDFSNVPEANKKNLAKSAVVLDRYIAKYRLDALALRCWNEFEQVLRHLSLCVVVLLK